MADDIRLSDNIEAEFNPLVVIVADEPHRYGPFSQALEKNGFTCQVYGELPENLIGLPTPGAIFFVSFNLKSMDASLLARRLEQKNNVCIVFAEQQGFDTAAKLSSAKMTQTLQHPYTEKNFVMAVQTIVKKRKVQHEKDLRKQSHLDRRKGMAEAAAVDETSADRIFKANAPVGSGHTPLIFEERRRGKKFFSIIEGGNSVQGHPRFMHDRRRRGLMAIQKGLQTATFSFHQAGKSGAVGKTVSGGAGARGDVHVQPGHSVSGGLAVEDGSNAAGKTSVQSSAVKPTKGAVLQEGSDSNEHSIVSSRPVTKDGIAYMPGVQAKVDAVASAMQERTAQIGAVIQKLADKLRPTPISETESRSATATVAETGPRAKAQSNSETETEVPPKTMAQHEAVPLAQEMTTIAGPLKVPTWALIAAFSIGILFILFFLYQMIFNRHH